MDILRWLVRVIVASIAGVAVGAATSLPLSAASLGGAAIATPRCTTAGLPVFQNVSGGLVISVTVTSLPASCGSATLQVTVNNGLVDASGSGTVPAGGGTVTVVLAASLAVTTSERTDLIVIGP